MTTTIANLNDDTALVPASLTAARAGLASHPLMGTLATGGLVVASSASHYAEQMARTSLGNDGVDGRRRLWTVSKVPLSHDGKQWPGAFGVQRDDTGARLGVVGPQYEPMQSLDAAQAFDVAFGHIPAPFRPALVNAGTLGGSARVFAQLALSPEFSALLHVPADRDSPTGAFYTWTNTHDGSTTANIGATCIRIVCRNTWQMAHKQTKRSGFALKHTVRNVEKYRASVTEWMKQTAVGYREQGERMRAYSTKVLSAHDVALTVDEILFGEVKETKTRQQREKADAIIELIEARDGQFVPVGDVTAYSVFNASTAYAMHRKPARGDGTAQNETRLWNVLSDDEISARAMEVLDAIVV